MGIGNDREIGPNRSVQNMSLNGPNDRRDAKDANGGLSLSEDDVLCKKGNAHDVVEVGMRDKDVADLKLIFQIKNVGEASCIE